MIAPVKVCEKGKQAITPVAASLKPDAVTTKEAHDDDINWSDDDSKIVDGANTATDAFPQLEAASEDDIEIITGDETDTTLVGSEDDIENVEIEEETVEIKHSDKTAKSVSKSTEGGADRKKNVVEGITIDDAAGNQKTNKEEAAEKQEGNDKYSAAGRNILFKGVETSLQFADVAMWVGVGVIGAIETRQITVDGVTVEVTVKLLEAKFDAPVTKDSNEVGEETYCDEEAGHTVFPTTELPLKLTVDTAVASRLHDTTALSRTASPAAPFNVVRRGKLPACRFGNQCKKRDTCMFDHSQPPTKQMCSFVNTDMGCSKGARCTYSHEYEGQMCRRGTARQECPNTFKCVFLHMDDEPPIKAQETSKFQVSDRPVSREASAAAIAERAAANRASREASMARAPPPNAPTCPKSNKRSRGADDTDTGFQAQRPRHSFQTPTYFGQQQLQPQQWQSMPDFALPTAPFTPPPGSYHSLQGQFVPAQVPYSPHQGSYNSGYAGNLQQRHGRGRGRGNGRAQGGGGGRHRGNARQNDR